MRRELVGYLPAKLQQTTSVQRWYRVHDVRNSEAQALTIALGSSFRRCRMRLYESESIHSVDRRTWVTAIRTFRSGSAASRSNVSVRGHSCMSGIHTAARRTDGFLCLASSVL